MHAIRDAREWQREREREKKTEIIQRTEQYYYVRTMSGDLISENDSEWYLLAHQLLIEPPARKSNIDRNYF